MNEMLHILNLFRMWLLNIIHIYFQKTIMVPAPNYLFLPIQNTHTSIISKDLRANLGNPFLTLISKPITFITFISLNFNIINLFCTISFCFMLNNTHTSPAFYNHSCVIVSSPSDGIFSLHEGISVALVGFGPISMPPKQKEAHGRPLSNFISAYFRA